MQIRFKATVDGYSRFRIPKKYFKYFRLDAVYRVKYSVDKGGFREGMMQIVVYNPERRYIKGCIVQEGKQHRLIRVKFEKGTLIEVIYDTAIEPLEWWNL